MTSPIPNNNPGFNLLDMDLALNPNLKLEKLDDTFSEMSIASELPKEVRFGNLLCKIFY